MWLPYYLVVWCFPLNWICHLNSEEFLLLRCVMQMFVFGQRMHRRQQKSRFPSCEVLLSFSAGGSDEVAVFFPLLELVKEKLTSCQN